MADMASILKVSALEILLPYYEANGFKVMDIDDQYKAQYSKGSTRNTVDIGKFKSALINQGVSAVIVGDCEAGASKTSVTKPTIKIMEVKK